MLVLLVSEVVSNAVRHSSGATRRQDQPAWPRPPRRLISIAGHGRRRGLHAACPATPSASSDGYGLYLLEKVSLQLGRRERQWDDRLVRAGPAPAV